MKRRSLTAAVIIGTSAFLFGCGSTESAEKIMSRMESANSLDKVLSDHGSFEISASYTDGGVTSGEESYISSCICCTQSDGTGSAFSYMDTESGFEYASEDEKFVYINDNAENYKKLFDSIRTTDLGVDANELSIASDRENTLVKSYDSITAYYVYDPDTYLLTEYYTQLTADGSENVHRTYTYNKESKDDEYEALADEKWNEYASGNMAEITLKHEDGTEKTYEVPEGWMISPIVDSACSVVYDADGQNYFYDPVKDGDVFLVKAIQ